MHGAYLQSQGKWVFLTFSCKIDKDSTKCQKGMGALCIDIHISYF